MIRRSIRLGVLYALEAVAVLLALLIFGAGAIFWRLSSGPIELDFLREDAQLMLAEAFEGDVVALGALEARYDTDRRALVLIARDVTVAEASGETADALVSFTSEAAAAVAAREARPAKVKQSGHMITGEKTEAAREVAAGVTARLAGDSRSSLHSLPHAGRS